MLLAVDIGNTNITFGVFSGKRAIRKFDIPTGQYTFRFLKKKIGRLNIEDGIICSVVPSAAKLLTRDLARLINKRPLVLGQNISVPIKNRYLKPGQVGQDRLVNAYAGVAFFGVPLIVVDFGTAVTFDVISRNKEYLGGMILPGLGISLDALAEKTALLPRIRLERPKELIGRDTKNSILSGVIYGFAALTDDLTKRIKEKIGKGAGVVATGGSAALIGKYCKCLDRIDNDLTLKGLNLIFLKRP